MKTNRRRLGRLNVDQLEDRSLMTGLALQPDYFNMLLPGNATKFPPAVVDVLANDSPQNLRILRFGEPSQGTVERVIAADGRETLQYNAGPSFRGFDFFSYTAVNDRGEEASDFVYIKFDYLDGTFNPWSVQAPESITVTPGTSTKLVDAAGKPLFAMNYQGQEQVSAGVLLSFTPYVHLYAAFGGFNTDVIRDDATFYPQPSGWAWVYGSIDGVNALLSGLNYTPTASITTTPDVSIHFRGWIYGSLGISVDSQSKSTKVMTSGTITDPGSDQNSPLALDDEYTIEASLDSIALDVLANDSARTTSGKLELIGVQTTGNPQGLVSIDPATNRLIYTPNPGFMGFDEYIYTIANENGLIAQALLKITVAPAMTFVGTTGDQRGTMIEVYDSLSGKLLNEFKPFGDYTGPMVMQSADANGDGKAELFAMQTGGDGRMRVFDSTGKTMVDTVYRPFGNRRISGMDMEVGNMDADNSPEMFFVANTSRGYELRVVDSSTMQTQMTTVMRGMSGTPQLEFDDTADKLMIMGRTRGGGVVMAAMTSNDSGQTNISRKTMVSDRDMRRMTRRNGPVTDVTLASTDQNGDGVMDAEMIQISFRNGLVQQMMLNDDGSVASSASRQATADQPQIIMAALGVAMTPTGDMVWTDTTDPSRRNRTRIVAIG